MLRAAEPLIARPLIMRRQTTPLLSDKYMHAAALYALAHACRQSISLS